MEAALQIVPGAWDFRINAVKKVKDAVFSFGTIDVYDLGILDISQRHYRIEREQLARSMSAQELEDLYRKSEIMCGDCAFQYVKKVIELAIAGEVDATVTNALNKDHMNMAGHHYSGHTEIYADFTNTAKYTMMLAHDNLRVVHVSTHVSLREACDRVKKDRVLDCIRIANEGGKALGIRQPKIGVAGLNPH